VIGWREGGGILKFLVGTKIIGWTHPSRKEEEGEENGSLCATHRLKH